MKEVGKLLRGSWIPVGPGGTARILTRLGWKAGLPDLTEGTRERLGQSKVYLSRARAEHTDDKGGGERRCRMVGRRPHRPV